MEVRPWLVLTGVLLLVAAAITAVRTTEYLHERAVIRAGPPVDATVVSVGVSMARQGIRDEDLRILLDYTTPQGQAVEAWGDLPRKPGELVSSKDIIRVHVGPDDSSYWTARDAPAPLGSVLTVPLLCLPAAALCAAIAWLRQRAMRKIDTDGVMRAAQVITVKLSPLAPFSKLVGLTLNDEPARRVLHCYWPAKCGPVRRGRRDRRPHECRRPARNDRIARLEHFHADIVASGRLTRRAGSGSQKPRDRMRVRSTPACRAAARGADAAGRRPCLRRS